MLRAIIFGLSLVNIGGSDYKTEIGPMPRQVEMKKEVVEGLEIYVSPLKYESSFSKGIEARGTVVAYGGYGTLYAKQTLRGKEIHVVLNDVVLEQFAAVLGDSLDSSLLTKFRGTVGRLTLDKTGDGVIIVAEKFHVINDPIQKAVITLNLKARTYQAKLWALGGLIEAAGRLPPSKEE